MEVQGLAQCRIVKSWGWVGCCIRSSEGGYVWTSTVTKHEDQYQASSYCLCWQCRSYLHEKKNITTTGHSKPVDIHYKFVTEHIEDGIIKVIFVKSADNDSDIMTKNLGSELYSKHASEMISMKEIFRKMEL